MAVQIDYAPLVAAVAATRDKDAFTRLFDFYAPRVKAYLLRIGTDMALAEELTQEVMATLWRKAALFDAGKSSLATWLYRIARNRRIDTLRRDRFDVTDPDSATFAIPDETDLDAIVDAGQREDGIRIAMATLPDEQHRLVRLAFFDGLSHSEIAERTGLPLGTVKSRIRLAFTRLRRALEAEGIMEVG